MKKIKDYLFSNPIALYSVLFIILIFLCSIPFITLSISPIWNADAAGQYYPAFLYIGYYLRNMLNSMIHGSLNIPAYDLKIGMGENIIGCLNYYGFGDPVNIIAVFANNQNGYIVYSIVYILRLYLAGLGSLIYSKEMQFNSKASAIGAIAYSFCGFALYGGLMYIEWLSVLFYFPLMIAGTEMIIKGKVKKAPLFVLSILYGALCGFYYLYMSSLALAVYCILRLLFKNGRSKIKQSIKCLGLLLALYILGIILASPFLIPSINAYLNSERNGDTISTITNSSLYKPSISNIRDFLKCSINVTKTYAMGIGIAQWCLIIISIFRPNTKRNIQIKLGLIITFIAISMPVTYWLFNGFGESNSRWYYIVHFFFMIVFVCTLSDMIYIISIISNKKRICAVLCICLICIATCANVVRNVWGLMLPYDENWGEEFVRIYDTKKYSDSPVAHSKMITEDKDLFRVDTDTFLDTIGRPENVAMVNNYNGCTYWFSMVNKYTQKYANQSISADLPWRSFGYTDNVYTEAMSGCKYYVSKNSNTSSAYNLIEIINFDDSEWYVYENPEYAGFAYELYENCKEYNSSSDGSLEDYNHIINQQLIEGAVDNISYDYTLSTFSCTTSLSGRLVVTIPYDEHWKAYVDGERVEINKFNAFISISIDEENHNIKIVY